MSMDRKIALLLVLLTAISLIATNITGCLPVQAESNIIVVPDTYRTIASAIGNATQGDIIFVKKGTYQERSLKIDKAIILVGEDRDRTIIQNIDVYNVTTLLPGFTPPLVAIEIEADNVKLWNFTITSNRWFLPVNASADGVQIVDNVFVPKSEGINVDGSNNIIARNSLSGIGNEFVRCTGSNNIVLENKLTGSASSTYGAIYVKGSSNLVYNNSIVDTGSWGFGRIRVYGDKNTVAKNNLARSAGIEIGRGSNNLVFGNRITFGGGISVTHGFNNIFCANHIENAGVGAMIGAHQDLIDFERSGPAYSNNTLYHNNFINNTEQVLTDWTDYGTNYFDNGNEGNYWSDYTGKDADGNGIGDTPYTIDYKRKDNFPLTAPFDVDSVKIELPEGVSVPAIKLPDFNSSELIPIKFVLVASGASATAICAGLLVYFKKHKS